MISDRIDAFMEEFSDKRVARTHVESFAEAERLLGKELSDFSRQEIIDAVKSGVSGYIPARDKLYVLQEYYKWAYGDALRVNVTLSDIDLSDSITRSLYPAFSSLYKELASVDDGDSIRPILYLCWLGLSYKQMTDIREDDVIVSDDGTITVHCGDKIFVDNDSCLSRAIKKYLETETYCVRDSGHEVPLCRSGYFIRKTTQYDGKDTPVSYAFISYKINTSQFLGKDVAYSGQFSRAFKAGISPTVAFPDLCQRMTYKTWRKVFFGL